MKNENYSIDPQDERASAAVERALAEGLVPIDPDGQRRQLIKARLLERARVGRQVEALFTTVRAKEGNWQKLFDGVRAKLLSEASKTRSFLLELARGASLPPHRHFDDEECIVLRGTLTSGRERWTHATYHVAFAGSRHSSIRAASKSVIFLRGSSLGGGAEPIRAHGDTSLRRRSSAPLTVRPDEGEWVQFVPGVEAKHLWTREGTSSSLLRIQPGGRLPPQAHLQDEETFVLEGETFFGDTLVRAGDYRLAPAGSPQCDLYSDVGALLFVRSAGLK